MEVMSKAERTITAAADLFMRYGYARTTMGEIARAAQISRPTLYALYPGKEEVFEAVVLHLNSIRLSEIEDCLRPLTSLADRLNAACRLWLVQVYGLQQSTPDARDMDDLSVPVVRKVYADLQNLIAGLFEESGLRLPADPHDLARLLVFSVRGLGVAATSVDDFTNLAKLEVAVFCQALAIRTENA